MPQSKSKKHGTRPAAVQSCSSTDDHEGHRWRFSEEWPEGVFWWCRGYNRAQAAQGVISTQKAIRRTEKRDKPSRARARRVRKLLAKKA